MWHKLISPFVGLLFVLTMSSCSGETTPPASGAPNTSSETPAAVETSEASSLTADEQFVANMHEAVPGSANTSDKDLVRMAKDICSQADEGYTFQGIAMAYVQYGFKPESVRELIQLAVPTYCPQHTKAMEVNLS